MDKRQKSEGTSFSLLDYLGQLLFPSHVRLRDKMAAATEELHRRNPPKEPGLAAPKVK